MIKAVGSPALRLHLDTFCDGHLHRLLAVALATAIAGEEDALLHARRVPAIVRRRVGARQHALLGLVVEGVLIGHTDVHLLVAIIRGFALGRLGQALAVRLDHLFDVAHQRGGAVVDHMDRLRSGRQVAAVVHGEVRAGDDVVALAFRLLVRIAVAYFYGSPAAVPQC